MYDWKAVDIMKQTMLSKFSLLAVVPAVLTLSGCLGGSQYLNQNGEKFDFKPPMLTTMQTKGGTYVLVEKSIADGKYQLVSLTKEKPKLTNTRQERIVVSADMKWYAVDFDAYQWETYVDTGNYNQKTDITHCGSNAIFDKMTSYNPCSTEFRDTFVPFSVTKAYTAGSMSYETKKRWESPRFNSMVAPVDPWAALYQSGALAKLGIVLTKK